MSQKPAPLILASASPARAAMLRAAGLEFSIHPAAIDEVSLQKKMRDTLVPAEVIATTLAQAKALSVTHQNPDAFVIGADQILYCQGRVFSKATTPDDAAVNFRLLRGRTHELISAVCVSHRNKVVWSHVERAKLTLRNLDDAAIDSYCARAGDVLTTTVGGYALEGLGSWLFERIDGDFFTVLGMPLLPLQHFLRAHGFGP